MALFCQNGTLHKYNYEEVFIALTGRSFGETAAKESQRWSVGE